MAKDLKELSGFLFALGFDRIGHTARSYLAHLLAVYRDLEDWGCDEAVCRGGMFHSIYGTERFHEFTLPAERRVEIRDLIGERAERLAYANCAMDRASFDQAVAGQAPPYRILDRLTGKEIELTPVDFDDLCRIHLCDWLEQVPRAQDWDYRRQSYRRLADRLGGVAADACNRVFALEAAR